MADYVNPYLGADNPYLTQKINQAQGDLARNFNMVAQPSYNSAMVRSGSFGNSGVQQMNENDRLNLANAMGRVGTDMRFNDYNNQQNMYQWDQGFSRSLYNDAYAQNNNDLQTQLGLLDRMQAYNTNDLNNANAIQNTPMNYWKQFTDQANALGNGYGTTTGQNFGGGPNPFVSALGGAQIGSSLGKSLSGWGGWDSGSYYPTQATEPNMFNNTSNFDYYGSGYSP